VTEDAKDLMPEHLRAIRKDHADTRREISGCLLGVEQHVVALSTDITNISERLARIEDRFIFMRTRLAYALRSLLPPWKMGAGTSAIYHVN
jgi:hypothetical protein